MVDIRAVENGSRQPDEYQLITGDGVQALVTTRPKQWQLHPTEALMVTMERYDGRVVAVSAAGATRRTIDNPDDQLPSFVPLVPASAGLTWYSVAFARAASEALTNRKTSTRSRWAERLRRIGLAVVIGGFITFPLGVIEPALSLHIVLAAEITATAATFLLLPWRAPPAAGNASDR